MTQLEKDRRSVPLGVIVREEQRQALAELARRRDRSVSSVTRMAIDAYLEREALDGGRKGGDAA